MDTSTFGKGRTSANEVNYDLPIHILILREELSRRIRSNSSYSLRSFAKHLDIDPSLLSKIINNSRPLSAAMATKILEKTEFTDSEKLLFWKSFVRTKQELRNEVKDDLPLPSKDEKLIEQNLFKTISEPHHYAIVELTRVKSFKSDMRWISQIMGLPLEETRQSVERLISIGMLQVVEGRIQRAKGRFTTKDKSVTDSAFKYHQRRILEQAILAMENTPIEQRNQTSMTVAINPKKIPIAKKMLEDFINQLTDVLETGPLEEVYQVSLSLFPICTPGEKS